MQLALDPGETTGWALYAGGNYWSGEVPREDVWKLLTRMRSRSIGMEVVVFENSNHQSSTKYGDLSAIKTIGVIEEWSRQTGVPLKPQQTFQKDFFTDEKLEFAGVLSESNHANDAMRHLLYFRGEWVPSMKSYLGDVYAW